jgi:hypothetical protein
MICEVLPALAHLLCSACLPLLCLTHTVPCHTGDKLRTELAATSADLSKARAAEAELTRAGEELRLQLGGMKQQLAKSTLGALEAKKNAEDMKHRVIKLNQNFMETSEWQAGARLLPAWLVLRGYVKTGLRSSTASGDAGGAGCPWGCTQLLHVPRIRVIADQQHHTSSRTTSHLAPDQLPLLTAEKLRADLTATESDLVSAKAAEAAAKEQLITEGEALRLELGGIKQQMAKNAAELSKERETAAALKERVMKLNTNFMQTSGWLCCRCS